MLIYIYSNKAETKSGGVESTFTTAKYLNLNNHRTYILESINELEEAIKKEKPDIILHHNYTHLIEAYNIAKKYNIPFIPTVNGLFTCGIGTHIKPNEFGFPCFNCGIFSMLICSLKTHKDLRYPLKHYIKMLIGIPYKYYKIKKRIKILNKCNAIIIIGTTIKEILEANSVKNKVYVVPQPIDDSFLDKPGIIEERAKKRILFTSGLDISKGALVLLKAFNNLKRDDVELIIIGRVYKEVNMKKFPKELFKNVKMIGEVSKDELKRYYYSFDILAFPSLLFEPFGRTWAEAAACGLPVIGFKDRGGPSDYLNAYFVSTTLIDMERGLNALLDDKGLRERLGKENREFAEKNLIASEVIKKLIEVYENEIRKT